MENRQELTGELVPTLIHISGGYKEWGWETSQVGKDVIQKLYAREGCDYQNDTHITYASKEEAIAALIEVRRAS